MPEVAVGGGDREHAERPGADRANGALVRRAALFVSVVLLAHLPLFLLHLGDLWQFRPHYRCYPVLLVGVVWLFWRRRVRFSGQVRPSWWSSVLLMAGWLTLTASVLFFSPWLAAVATLLSLGGLIGRYAVAGQASDWVPVWAVMWLIVPPPREWDVRLIEGMQASALQTASRLFDLLGIRHLMEGNVLVLPGYRIPAERACEGVNSLVLLLIVTALFVVAVRRPLLRSIPLLAGVFLWVWLANVVRAVTLAWALFRWQFDWLVGWRHASLGFATFLLAVVLLASMDRLLDFLLRPFVLEDSLQRPSVLIRVWNWLVDVRPLIGDAGQTWRDPWSGPESDDDERDGATGAGRQASLLSSFPRRHYLWIVAFGLLGMLQVIGFIGTADASPSIHQPTFSRPSMPERFLGWTLVEYEGRERGILDASGRFSSQWYYRCEPLACRISIEYPFSGWHELTLRYQSSGWRQVARRMIDDQGEPDPDGGYVEVELSMPTGEYGWLLFGLVDQRGNVIAPVSGTGRRTLVSELVRHRPGDWLVRRNAGTVTRATYLVQAFVTSSEELCSRQRAEFRELFQVARSRALSASLGRSIEAETNP